MRHGIALASILVLLLSACAGEEEEGAPESIGDMSAREILDEVVAAATSIDSVRVESTQNDTQHASPFPGTDSGEPQTTRGLSIITPDGSYNLDKTLFEDPCPLGADWCASSPFPTDETLWYKGKFYVRFGPDGEWTDPATCQASQSGCGGALCRPGGGARCLQHARQVNPAAAAGLTLAPAWKLHPPKSPIF